MPQPVVCLAVGIALLKASVAFGQSPSIDFHQAAKEYVQSQRTSTAKKDNPYELPALALMGLGGTLAVVALTAAPSINCADTPASGVYQPCTTGHHPVLLTTGAAMAGLGAVLWFKGESQRRPDIAISPTSVVLRHRFNF